jgi:CTP:phosphocholine cytidylyltransferase-like protein
MISATLIHNDDAKCFHVVVQGTHKLVMMGCVNFEDHAIIKIQCAYEKMNVTGRMFKDEKKWGNYPM